MKRSLRRWQQYVARVRKANLFWFSHGRYGRAAMRERIHQPPRKWMMREPCGEWNRCQHLRPARVRSNQLERLIEIGRDSDSLNFPDYKRPRIWYW